ncbi:MAG: 2-amino-4-hydroxy-6-hydroxymethyldihydropteridine diphosphokinase [Plesiomonas sp.]|uniref:2-amino-4-hydroxy-6- hydroxymethyldihydropteridine diphosphokinase n=1 Tax=Plesiomonas sp. TaxID=2486279 RepID=UPI003F3790C8
MIRVYIAIGSNLIEPVTQAREAIAALKQLPNSRWIASSSLYRSKPMGPQDQPDYINAVVALDTTLSPLELLDATQHIELQHGRQRKTERWGPRTLDLDILLYGNMCIDHPRLVVPHYGMTTREFVLYPLAEIAPDLILPDNTTLQHHRQQVACNDLICWLPT